MTSSKENPIPGPGEIRPADGISPSFESGASEEIPAEILNRRICDFKLQIEKSPLESIISGFRNELTACGITRLTPQFYLSDEWGVPDGSVAIGIPFYLASENLSRIQQSKGGLIEGIDPDDILRYLRHEMGHVVNYAYRIYEAEAWTSIFGPMARPYNDEFLAVPFSPDFVRHLPGNYAQKHPDDDWAETFAVWMTPGLDWRNLYSDAPGALCKLEYCDRTIEALRNQTPDLKQVELDGAVDEMALTLQSFYDDTDLDKLAIPHSLDGDLRGIFSPWSGLKTTSDTTKRGYGALLIRRNQDLLANTIYRWTGVDPRFLHPLLVHLAKQAEALALTYPLAERDTILIQLSAFLSTLAMNKVYKGKFFAT